MSSLKRFEDVLNELISDKITARKKAQDDFGSFLFNNKDIVKKLTENSSWTLAKGQGHGEGPLTWQRVFQFAIRHLEKESAKLEKDHNNGKNVLDDPILSGKAFAVVKKTLRSARNNFSDPKCVIKELLDVLERVFRRQLFGVDCVNILVEIFEADPRFQWHFSARNIYWRKMTSLSLDLFVHPLKKLNFLTASKFFLLSVKLGHKFSSCPLAILTSDETFKVIEDLLKSPEVLKAGKDSQTTFVEAVNAFAEVTADDRREKLCSLGENCLPQIVQLFDGVRGHHDEKLARTLLKFLNLQMTLHHPHHLSPSFYGDEKLWVRHLYSMYTNLIDTFIANAARKSNFHLSLQHRNFAAKVIFQLHRISLGQGQGHSVMDVTQHVQRDQTQMEPPGSKRRRIQTEKVDLDSLLAKLDLIKNDHAKSKLRVLPWIQILYSLLTLNRDWSKAEFLKIHRKLSETLRDSKSNEIRKLLLTCFLTLDKFSCFSDEWNKLLPVVINIVSSNNCVEEGHELLRKTIANGALKVGRDLYGFYLNKIIRRSSGSIRTLIRLIERVSVPGNREGLLKWLYDEEDNEEMEVEWSKLMTECPIEIARLLFCLLVKIPPEMNPDPEAISSRNCELAERILDRDLTRLPFGLNPKKSNNKSAIKEAEIRDAEIYKAEFGDKIHQLLSNLAAKALVDLAKHPLPEETLIEKVEHNLGVLAVLAEFVEICGNFNLQCQRIESALENFLRRISDLILKFIMDDTNLESKIRLLAKVSQLALKCPLLRIRSDSMLQLVTEKVKKMTEKVKKSPRKVSPNKDRNMILVEDDDDDDPEFFSTQNSSAMDMDVFNDDEVDLADLLLRQKMAKETLTFAATALELSLDDQKLLLSSVFESTKTSKTASEFEVRFDMLKITLRKCIRSLPSECMDFLTKLPAMKINKRGSKLIAFENFNPDLITDILTLLTEIARNAKFDDSMVVYVTAFVKMHSMALQGHHFERLPCDIQCQLIELMGEMVKHHREGDLMWEGEMHFKCSNSGDDPEIPSITKQSLEVPMKYGLLRFLTNKSARVRYSAAKSVQNIFLISSNMKDRKKDFDLLHRHLVLLHNYPQEPFGDAEIASTVMMTLSSLSCTCPTLSREAITGILLTSTAIENGGHFGKRVIGNLSGGNNEAFLATMLSYIFKEFLRQNGFEKFPFSIMNNDEFKDVSDFLNKYESVVVPLCLWRSPKKETLAKLSRAMKKTGVQLLTNTFSHTLAYYLPFVAAKDSDQEDILFNALKGDTDKIVARTNNMHNLIETSIGKEKFHRLLNEFMPEVISRVLKGVFDPDKLWDVSVSLMVPNPPFASEDLIKHLFKYLGEIARKDKRTLMDFLVELKPDSLQRITQESCRPLREQSASPDSHVRALHGIKILMESLRREEKAENVKKQIKYFVWFVTNSLLTVLKISGFAEVKILVCKLLDALLDVSSDDLMVIPIKNSMINLAKTEGFGLEILNKLVSKFGAESVGQFPDESIFADLRNRSETNPSLGQVIRNFVEISGISDAEYLDAALSTLLTSLRTEKAELNSMVNSESSEISTLVKSLMNCGNNVLASQCLGEIGPVPKCDFNEPRQVIDHSEYLTKIIEWLIDLLTSEDNHTIDASSQALKLLLSTMQGKNLTKNHLEERKYHFSVPFRIDLDGHPTLGSEVGEDFESLVDSEELWLTTAEDHNSWICNLVSTILRSLKRNSRMKCLEEVCKLQPKFAEKIFPILIHEILYVEGEFEAEILSRNANSFFEHHCKRNSDVSSDFESKSNSFTDLSSVRVMLDLVAHLRGQKHIDDGFNKWRKNFHLPTLNYLYVAKSALSASEFSSAVLYADIWAQETRRLNPDINRTSSAMGQCESLLNILNDTQCQEILYLAYKNLGDSDALYGCGSGIILASENSNGINHLIHEQKYFKAMSYLDSVNGMNKMGAALYESGLYNTFMRYNLEGDESDSMAMDYRFDCAWRLGKWDEGLAETNNKPSFHQGRSLALKDFLSGQKRRFLDHLDRARLAVDFIGDSNKNVQLNLSKLKTLREMEVLSEINDPDSAFTKIFTDDFDLTEAILLQRCVLLENLSRNSNDAKMKNKFDKLNVNYSLEYIDKCTLNGKLQQGHHRLEALTKNSVFGIERLKLDLRKAKLYWMGDERIAAKFHLNDLKSKLEGAVESEQHRLLLGDVLQTQGKWNSETKSANIDEILNKNLLESVRIFESCSNAGDEKIAALVQLAKFCDEQYSRVTEVVKSKEYEEKKKVMKAIQDEMKMIKPAGRDMLIQKHTLVSHSNIDKREVEAVERDQAKYLTLAIQNYGKALQAESAGVKSREQIVYRLIALWFANPDFDIGAILSGIESAVFVGLLNQLSARLSDSNEDKFGKTLARLITRCGLDHPYHTIPVLLGHVNAFADEQIINNNSNDGGQNGSGAKKRRRGSIEQQPLEMDDRGKAAEKILVYISKKNREKAKMIANFRRTSTALINLAYSTPPGNASLVKLSPDHPICGVNGCGDVPVLTVPIKVNRSKDYGDEVTIEKYDRQYELVGGINAPKKIQVLGSDGKKRTELVKGKDDLRQDAVMQQVFGLLNALLKEEGFRMREYKVMPLSQRSGVLEWCENSMPVQAYLLGDKKKKGAHERYHPEDVTANQCRVRLNDIQTKNKANTDKLAELFVELCAGIKPAMRFFFHENFPSPLEFVKVRTAYTRSAAVASMIGYVLGIGDRHLQNILIDKATAELIHIDFGIAFEQGRILPSPETIPFRLTRDIVDGFGVSGVEGAFRRSCEMTLDVLRSNKEEILTVLEVLIFDPLYNWSLTVDKAYKVEHGREAGDDLKKRWKNVLERNGPGDEVKEVNKMAERVLRRVGQKLDGFEEGQLMSIEGQVNTLIQQARDPRRLCSLFRGWQAYL